MNQSRKRARVTPIVIEKRQRRPVDKSLTNVGPVTFTTTQNNTSLITATFPCTITGIRWSFTFLALAGENSGAWAIIRVKDGLTPGTMSFTSGSDLFDPEQECIAFGRWAVNDTIAPSIQLVEGNTKSMRKLMGGDQIYFIVNGTVANNTSVSGTVQYFAKS